jgi:hypothetical protein
LRSRNAARLIGYSGPGAYGVPALLRTSNSLEHVMNFAEKPHQDADSAVNSVYRRTPVFRIRKPFLSKFITASRIPKILGRWQHKGERHTEYSSAIHRQVLKC